MASIKTAFAFAKNIKTTGALFETSHRASDEISRYIVDDKVQIVVEYGAGHGNITRKALSRMHPQSRLYAFEINEDFCNILSEINDDRLTIINDSAQSLGKYVTEDVDCILSTLPFTLISNPILRKILSVSRAKLRDEGVISQILYSSFHYTKYEEFFRQVSCELISYVPPEYIYHCRK